MNLLHKWLKKNERPSYRARLYRGGALPTRGSLARTQGQRIAAELRLEVLSRHHFQCHYCREHLTAEDGRIDVAIPMARGGSLAVYNLRAACSTCLAEKGGKTEVEYLLWKLLEYGIPPCA